MSKKISKIVVKTDLCIGAGPCEVLAPETFEVINGKAVVKNVDGNTFEEIISAAKSCPVFAIEIYDENGKLIWPENN